MMPILFEESEQEFNSNGIGILNDCVTCDVVQELNGQYELTLKYPVSGIHFAFLGQRRIILAKTDLEEQTQPFRIYRITKPLGGIVTVLARHIAYDLGGAPVSPFIATSAADALVQMKTHCVTECPFQFTTDKSTVAQMKVAVPNTIWNLLGGTQGSILDVYGGEYIFDRLDIKLIQRRGADRGVSVRYGKNLKNLEQDECCANCYTAVYPYWTDSEGQLVELPEKTVNAAGNYSYVRIRVLDLSAEWQEAPTAEQLRNRTERYITENQIGVPQVSWKIEFSQNEQENNHRLRELEHVALGDSVSVAFSDMGIHAMSRVVAIVFDSILEKHKSVTLGRVKANLAKTIASQQFEIAQKASVKMVERATMSLTGRIWGATGGAARFLDEDGDNLPDTLYIADDPDPQKAKRLWRWNYEGWAASTNGYNGPFIMGATLENGLLAEAITAANLIAGTIKSADGKTFFLDLDKGILRMAAEALSIDGKTVEKIAEECAEEAIKNQSQEAIFNILSNNGEYDGIWMQDGKIYFNLTYAQSGYLSAENIKLSGKFTVYSDTEDTAAGGYIGYMSGSSGNGNKTDGIGISNENETVYIIITTRGVRLQAGSVDLNIPLDGAVNVNGDLKVNGNIYYSGELNDSLQGGTNEH